MQMDLVVKGTKVGNYARERMEHKLAKAVERFHREIPVRVSVEEKKRSLRGTGHQCGKRS